MFKLPNTNEINKIKVEVCDQVAVIEKREAVLFVWMPLL